MKNQYCIEHDCLNYKNGWCKAKKTNKGLDDVIECDKVKDGPESNYFKAELGEVYTGKSIKGQICTPINLDQISMPGINDPNSAFKFKIDNYIEGEKLKLELHPDDPYIKGIIDGLAIAKKLIE